MIKEGEYEVRPKCKTYEEARVLGVERVYPSAVMETPDGVWCYFYKGNKHVWTCLSDFAEDNLIIKKL